MAAATSFGANLLGKIFGTSVGQMDFEHGRWAPIHTNPKRQRGRAPILAVRRELTAIRPRWRFGLVWAIF